MSVIGNQYFAILLFCSCLSAQDLVQDQNQISSGSFTTINEPLLLDNSYSSVVINETNALSDIDCALRCLSKQSNGCIAVVAVTMTKTCQLVYINNESLLDDPLGYGHVRRSLGSQPGAKVWKVSDFDDILLSSSIRKTTFKNTSTGRSGSIQKINVSDSGCYRIEAAGAKGGDNTYHNKYGGSGSLIRGKFNLSSGTQLSIVVGQSGGQGSITSSGAGGGGGSFVYITAESELLIAAGGGGGASRYYHGKPGEPGVNGTGSLGLTDIYYGFGGVNGQPGSNAATTSNHGGCGAGWLGKPVNPRKTNTSGDRGGSLDDGWVGGIGGTGTTADGGFGGGGGGGGAAGAGGGFSGGGAGMSYSHSGGGGGSYCSGFGCNATRGSNTDRDSGYVTLQLLRAPCN